MKMVKSNKKIIGIIGPSGSRKTILAKKLWKSLPSATISSFSYPLRRFLYLAEIYNNPWNKMQKDKYNYGIPITTALRLLGKYFRETYGNDILVKMMKEEIKNSLSIIKTIIIDDVCMPEELKWLQKQDAIIIVLLSPFEKKPDWVSETEEMAWKIIFERTLPSFTKKSNYKIVFFSPQVGESDGDGLPFLFSEYQKLLGKIRELL